MTKIFIFNGVIWNSLLVMLLCENNYHARFIGLFYFIRYMKSLFSGSFHSIKL